MSVKNTRILYICATKIVRSCTISFALCNFFIPLCFVIFILCSEACSTPEKYIRRAEAAWAIGEYEVAATQYKRAYSRTPVAEKIQRGKLSFLMGECYRHYGYSSRALGAYKVAERYRYTDTTTLLRKGQMLLLQGDYKQARDAFQNFLTVLDTCSSISQDKSTESLRSMAESGIVSCDKGPTMKAASSLYTVKMAAPFNSNRSDYCPMLLGNLEDKDVQLFISSTRNAAIGKDISGITGQKNGDIFVAKKDEKGKWKTVESIENGPNSDLDEGAPCFSSDGKTMYFTACPVDPEYPRMAEIRSSSRNDASWGKAETLKITGDTLSSYAHPALSPDGDWLYFTSDMPGGYGGKDIWRAALAGGKVRFVENLGPDINTAGDECFPAFRPTGELYFSSDGRGGMGGLDLYHALEDTITHSWSVQHLPAPMNSFADDFGITFDGLHNRGFFSSSRSTKGRGWDKIYEFSYPEILLTVKGYVYEQDGYELPEAMVYMIGSDGTNQKLTMRSDGTFDWPVTPGVDYLFLATCKGYLNVPASLHVDSLEAEYTYELDFPLPSVSIPVLVKNVFYAFDSAEITPESSTALDKLARLLEENPNITIELAAHCDYRGRDDYNLSLSQRRAESVTSYLTGKNIAPQRLTAKGYGETQPKVVTAKLASTFAFLHEGDTLTETFITALDSITQKPRFNDEEKEICNALNRRTEFRVLRTTYGLFDEEGNLRPDAIIPSKPISPEDLEDFEDDGNGNRRDETEDEEYEYVE